MKIDDVPQDKGYLVKGRISDLSYAVDHDGKYTSTQSEGWAPKNEAMSLAWDVVYERTENARNQVLAGVWSPIAFYMELNIMDIHILSNYTGIPRWKVKRHLKMGNFLKLKPEILGRYAEAFKLTPGDLKDVDKIREVKIGHEN